MILVSLPYLLHITGEAYMKHFAEGMEETPSPWHYHISALILHLDSVRQIYMKYLMA